MERTSTSTKANLKPGPIEKFFELGRAVTEKAKAEGGYGTGFLAELAGNKDFDGASHNKLQRAQQVYQAWDLELARKADLCGLPLRHVPLLLGLEASSKEQELAQTDALIAANIAIRIKKRDELLDLHRDGKLRGNAFREHVQAWRKQNLHLFGAGDAAKVMSDSARALKRRCGKLKGQFNQFRRASAVTAKLNGMKPTAKDKKIVAALTCAERALAHVEKML